MTHQRAEDFLDLELMCDTVKTEAGDKLKFAIGNYVTSSAVTAMQRFDEAEKQYAEDKALLLMALSEIDITPLSVLRANHWEAIRNMYKLFEMTFDKDGNIHVEIPEGWASTFDVVSNWQSSRSVWSTEELTKQFVEFTDRAFAEAMYFSHFQLLQLLMPEFGSLPHGVDYGEYGMKLKVTLAPPPKRVMDLYEKLQAAGVEYSVAADQSAIAFSPSLPEQLAIKQAVAGLEV